MENFNEINKEELKTIIGGRRMYAISFYGFEPILSEAEELAIDED